MRNPEAALLAEIEAFIAERGMSASRFGLETVNDCNLVKQLRGKRSVTLRTATKIQSYIQRHRAKEPAAAE
jgi:hypothetical protein